MKTGKWKDLEKRKFTEEEMRAQDVEVARELLEISLREAREMSGRTQEEVAAEMDVVQGEVSRLESRDDMKLSTIRRFVEAIGGDLVVLANFDGKSVRLKI